MPMKELLSRDCGQQNPVLRVASHFAGSASSDGASIAPINLVGPGQSIRDHSHSINGHHGREGQILLPPTTFRMDSLLKEIQSMDRSHGPTQAPRVADLTRNEEWIQEFQSSKTMDGDFRGAHGIDPHQWAEEYRNGPLDLDRAWESPVTTLSSSMMHPYHHHHHPQHFPQNSMLGSAKDLLEDSRWTEEYDQQSKTELMTTAEEFIQSIKDPTIKATDFMSFVEKLSTGEATVGTTNRPDMAENWAGEYEAQTSGTTVPQTDEAWAREYTDSDDMNPREREEFWQRLQSEWDRAAEESGLHPWLSEASQQFDQPYRFEEENPYKETEDALEEGKRRLMVSDIPAAALLFEAAVQKHIDNPEAWYLLGTTQALNEQDPQAISALSKCIDLEPGNLKALMALAASLTNESYYFQACRILKTWLKQNPEYADLVPENIGKPPLTSSILPSNELSAVQALYMKAARKRPAHDLDPDIQCGLGVLFNLSSDFEKAGDCFQAAVNADPNDALLWNRLGATLANGGKSAEAIGTYSKALEIIPGFIRTRYNLGIACVNLGSSREAAEHFLLALNMQASSSKPTISKSSSVTNHGNSISDSIWTSLRMVLHLLDKGTLSPAIDRRDLDTLNQEFQVS